MTACFVVFVVIQRVCDEEGTYLLEALIVLWWTKHWTSLEKCGKVVLLLFSISSVGSRASGENPPLLGNWSRALAEATQGSGFSDDETEFEFENEASVVEIEPDVQVMANASEFEGFQEHQNGKPCIVDEAKPDPVDVDGLGPLHLLSSAAAKEQNPNPISFQIPKEGTCRPSAAPAATISSRLTEQDKSVSSSTPVQTKGSVTEGFSTQG
ncbi:hypothetical protein BDW74DRAFT_177817 [Aspergillus multicolor]|uniref:uncharacterized protein n=1 Tax=Aspergillus multicolor TaxID=41759 RepID=UPI003CCD3C71